ncbi:MAG: DUF4132 domain-containing protein [Armatimonadetes bacterium]|nr:DUF4132 domain-containing protein [Armatimonadota bacterium]
MLEWIRGKMSRKALKNPCGLSSEDLTALREEFQGLDAIASSAGAGLELPALSPIDAHPPGPALRNALDECWAEIPGLLQGAGPAPSADQVWQAMVGQGRVEPMANWAWPPPHLSKLLRRFLEHPELDLLRAVRFLAALGGFTAQGVVTNMLDEQISYYRRAHRASFGLRELGAAMQHLRLNPDHLGRARLKMAWGGRFLWEAPAVWPYFSERLHLIDEALADTSSYNRAERRLAALEILGYLPEIPTAYVEPLWEMALGNARNERGPAQGVLEKVPGFESRLLAALDSKRQEVRAEAAAWIGRLGLAEAESFLRRALEKEKQDLPRAAIMGALDRSGVPLDEFLDRPALLGDARKILAKGLPEGLSWFPWDRLPTLHWKDTGEEVPVEVLQSLLVRSHKLGNPEPGPLLRLYGSSWREREELGVMVLEAWIARDTRPANTPHEAAAKADASLRLLTQQQPDVPPERLRRQLLQAFLDECEGSAIKEKGLLAVAGACQGPRTVRLVEQYLRRWYGLRAAQCKALLSMLAWSDHPLGLQLLLGVARRFRTRGIQKEAQKLAETLAERKGWTVAELADRTIPTAGLDADGRLELDYGERKFFARLGSGPRLELEDSGGKPIKALPEARKDEDPELVKQAKKAFSAAKKELKAVLAHQKERLYEAMCTQRTWTMEDQTTCLAEHPILGESCRRLVWIHGEPPAQTFRRLEDGSLTDARDQEVFVEPGAVVRLAHSANTSAEVAAAWRAHLADYEVEPLFVQFQVEVYRLDESRRMETELNDFQGHVLEAYRLRGRAAALGYSRGAAEDGAWFYTYHKRFVELGLEAILEFTGNALPEENRTVALTALSFAPTAESGYGAKLPLGEVPPVLLSECWNAMRRLAAEGSGFSPEWEKLG